MAQALAKVSMNDLLGILDKILCLQDYNSSGESDVWLGLNNLVQKDSKKPQDSDLC